MTGRRLYELFCDTHKIEMHWSGSDVDGGLPSSPRLSWPYLHRYERDLWNALARRLKGVKRS